MFVEWKLIFQPLLHGLTHNVRSSHNEIDGTHTWAPTRNLAVLGVLIVSSTPRVGLEIDRWRDGTHQSGHYYRNVKRWSRRFVILGDLVPTTQGTS